MRLHIAYAVDQLSNGKSQYRLIAHLHPAAVQLHLIRHYHLDRFEVFVDPHRQQLDQASATAHDQACARGLFTTSTRTAGSIWASEIRAVWYALRACRAFRITVADLLDGVTITHTSLRSLTEVERVLVACVDHIDRVVRDAGHYADRAEELLEPDAAVTDDMAPNRWPRLW